MAREPYTKEEHELMRRAYKDKVPLLEIVGQLTDRTPGGLIQEIKRQARFGKWGEKNLEFYAAEWRTLRNDPAYGYKKREPREKGREDSALDYCHVDLNQAWAFHDKMKRDLGYELREAEIGEDFNLRLSLAERVDPEQFMFDLRSHFEQAAKAVKIEVSDIGMKRARGFYYIGVNGQSRELLNFLYAYLFVLHRGLPDAGPAGFEED